MSNEAEILTTCLSCHGTHVCQKSSGSRGSCISRVSVLQKVTLKKFTFFSNNQEWPRFRPFRKINVLSLYSSNLKDHRLYDRTVGITGEFESHALRLIINYGGGGGGGGASI